MNTVFLGQTVRKPNFQTGFLSDASKVFYLGKEEGREEGAEGNKINNVKNLLTSTNLTPETIASCICLPLDQVLQIQKELQN